MYVKGNNRLKKETTEWKTLTKRQKTKKLLYALTLYNVLYISLLKLSFCTSFYTTSYVCG